MTDMGDFKGWERVSDNEYVAELGELGRIGIIKDVRAKHWIPTVFGRDEPPRASKKAAQRKAIVVAADRLQVALHRLDSLTASG
jgi:hypothetical protein